MWKLLSFVLRSKQRKKILLSLKNPKTPTQIASEVKVSVAHVSRTLREFSDKGLVECRTPKEKIGRIYELTEMGQKIAKKIEETEK